MGASPLHLSSFLVENSVVDLAQCSVPWSVLAVTLQFLGFRVFPCLPEWNDTGSLGLGKYSEA